MKNRLLLVTLLAVFTALSSGCATVVALQLKNKLPKVEADDLTVTVNVAGIGGGTAQVKAQHYDANGNLIMGELHEIISTPTGSIKIDGTNVRLPARK